MHEVQRSGTLGVISGLSAAGDVAEFILSQRRRDRKAPSGRNLTPWVCRNNAVGEKVGIPTFFSLLSKFQSLELFVTQPFKKFQPLELFSESEI